MAESLQVLQEALVCQGTLFMYFDTPHTVMGTVPEESGDWQCKEVTPRGGSTKKLFISVKVIVEGIEYI